MSRADTLSQIAALEEEIKRRKAYEGLTQYMPRSFHWEFFSSERQTRLFVGSNQSGKTSIVSLIAAGYALGHNMWVRNFYNYCVENNPKFPKPGWWFDNYEDILDYEFPDCDPPVKIAVVAIDFKSAVVDKILDLFPKPHRDGEHILRVEKSQHNIHKIIFQNGSVIQFFSSVQDAMHFEGGTWDLIIFDEPPHQEHFVAMRRGALVKQAPMLFSMTPLNEPWIFDTLMADANKQDTNVFMSTCNLYSDEIDWMTKEDKDDFKKQTERENPHAVRARIYGEFTHLMGRIYQSYDPAVHRIPSPELRPEYTYGMTMDPHDRKPFALAWWYVDSLGKVTFFREWPNTMFHEMRSCDFTVQNYVDKIRDVEDKLPAPVKYRYIDPNSGPRRYALTGQSFVDEFGNHGLYFDHEINDKIEYGHGVVRDWLWYDTDKEVSSTNCPKVYISEDCENMCYAVERYTWDEKRASKGLSEKPQEKFKDFMDVKRYTLVKEPVWIPPGGDQIYNPPTFSGSMFSD